MQRAIEIEINLKKFKSVVAFEMHDGEVSDINCLHIFVNDVPYDAFYLIEDIKESLVEDITDLLVREAA